MSDALTFTRAPGTDRWDAQQVDGEFVAYVYRHGWDNYGARIRDEVVGGGRTVAIGTTLEEAMHKVVGAWAECWS